MDLNDHSEDALEATGEITDWLLAWRRGQVESAERLMPPVASALRELAARHMRRETDGHTLTPTALVNEAWLRLAEQQQVEFRDRAHFLAVASRVMRRVLVDYARRTQALKRMPIGVRLDTFVPGAAEDWAFTLLAIDRAMEQLAQVDARLARVVDCRFFAGLTEEETAQTLDISERTMHRDWLRARAWLELALRD